MERQASRGTPASSGIDGFEGDPSDSEALKQFFLEEMQKGQNLMDNGTSLRVVFLSGMALPSVSAANAGLPFFIPLYIHSMLDLAMDL